MQCTCPNPCSTLGQYQEIYEYVDTNGNIHQFGAFRDVLYGIWQGVKKIVPAAIGFIPAIGPVASQVVNAATNLIDSGVETARAKRLNLENQTIPQYTEAIKQGYTPSYQDMTSQLAANALQTVAAQYGVTLPNDQIIQGVDLANQTVQTTTQPTSTENIIATVINTIMPLVSQLIAGATAQRYITPVGTGIQQTSIMPSAPSSRIQDAVRLSKANLSGYQLNDQIMDFLLDESEQFGELFDLSQMDCYCNISQGLEPLVEIIKQLKYYFTELKRQFKELGEIKLMYDQISTQQGLTDVITSVQDSINNGIDVTTTVAEPRIRRS